MLEDRFKKLWFNSQRDNKHAQHIYVHDLHTPPGLAAPGDADLVTVHGLPADFSGQGIILTNSRLHIEQRAVCEAHINNE